VTGPDANLCGSATFSFGEAASAARYAKILGALPAGVAALLPQFLAEAGNPDQSVLQMEVLLQQHPAEALAAFEGSSLALRSCVALFGASQWLGQSLIQNPELLQVFSRRMGLASGRLGDDFREQFARFRLRFHELALPVLLARFKRREYVRIFVRELLGLASLAEITEEISALSDVLIEEALTHCESELRRRYQGWPQLRSSLGRVYPARFSVLALGKLGGNELNYSSDIDLLYLCDDAGDAGSIAIPAREFFTRLAQELTAVLGTVSAEGPVFRVDLRLRPQGSSGEMVAGCAQALRYYRGVAEDWELQALLKLRPSAGDATLARQFVQQVQKLIYRDPLSFSAIQTAARSLEKIKRGVVRQGTRELDVKSGAGGLREIEFVVQCLQRVHGGREPWLRSSGTMPALQKLHDKGHIGDAEFRELCQTYAVLRAVEHRLQCLQGAPSHRLPRGAGEQAALFRSLGAKAVGDMRELKRMMKSAEELCSRVLRLGSGEGPEEVTPSAARLGSPGAERLMRELAARSPSLASALAAEVGDTTRRNLQRFLAAAATGEERIRVTLENVEWVERALPVFAQSALATEILARHPQDIGALFGEMRGKGQGEVQCDAGENAGRAISDQLRIESRRGLLRCVGRSLLEEKSVWEILREYSGRMEAILRKALSAAEAPEGFAVFAVGRLGTCELDAVSDLDVVFVRDAECASDEAERCARALVSMLSGYTREGSVIAVDTRMRPHGAEGDLVVSARQLTAYFESEAKAWEAIAFSKMRLVAGAEHLAEPVRTALNALRKRFAASPAFVPQLRAVRKRLEDSVATESFKTGPGGLYDMDFLLGLLEARSGLESVGKQFYERLAALVVGGHLAAGEGRELLQAAEVFRRVDHAVRIVEGRSRRWLPESDELRSSVERVAGYPDLEAKLRAEMGVVRSHFDSIFSD
jgi:glutamate-ammonia-ligase adenylyltransferase